VLRHWDERSLAALLDEHGLGGVAEAPFPNDGWSGATLTLLEGGGRRYVLKRTSWAQDWIARATRDHHLREGFVATGQLPLPSGVVAPYLGAAADDTAVAMLMPDLSAALITWERPDGAPTVDRGTLDRVLVALAALHATPPPVPAADRDPGRAWPWCPLRERLLLLTPASAARFDTDGVAAGARFLAGWAAFRDEAPASARDLVERLDADPSPLLQALGRLPMALLHGDPKVANVALLDGGEVAFIDWQMTTVAPVAVDLGWLLVSNSSSFADPPEVVLERYRSVADDAVVGDWPAQRDLSVIVGLLLRGWRKGLDAAAGGRLACGRPARDDLAWWAEEAVAAADRVL
jgi:aminoglycoside phosphotransferase (APT) family kinase protein